MVSMYSTATAKSKRLTGRLVACTLKMYISPFWEVSIVKAVSVRNARSHLKALLDLVAAGEEIVICRRGKVAARLVPPAPKRRRRPDLTAFRNTICLKGEPVSVTGRTHGSRSVLALRRHER